MSTSELMRQDHEAMRALHRRMTPEERLVAFFRHSQLVYQLYQAGARHRARQPSAPPVSKNQPTRS
jgi:hypothetical protein